MLSKELFSKTLNTVSTLALSGVLLGSTLLTHSWAMDEDWRDKDQKSIVPAQQRTETTPSVLNDFEANAKELLGKFVSFVNENVLHKQPLEENAQNTVLTPLRKQDYLPMPGDFAGCPKEIVLIIMSFLGKNDLHNFGMTAKSLCLASYNPAVNDRTMQISIFANPDKYKDILSIREYGELPIRLSFGWFSPKIEEIFPYFPYLVELKLKTWLDEEEIIKIANELPKNSTLTSLKLVCGFIGDQGTTRISQALLKNSTLKTLNLQHNQIGLLGVGGSVSMSNTLKVNSILTALDLSDNECIGAKGASLMSQALLQNSTLLTLNLNDCCLGSPGAISLSEVLKKNTTLTILNLKGNNITDKGFIKLADALRINSTLRELDLRKNYPGEKGVKALISALEQNSILSKLNGSPRAPFSPY